MKKLTITEKRRGKMIDELIATLQWCSAASDFAPHTGIARKGWEEIVIPVMEKARKMIGRDGQR